MPNTILYISYFGKTKISSNQELIKHASYDKVNLFTILRNHCTLHLFQVKLDHIIRPLLDYK